MDALTTLLDGPRARGAFLIRAVMAPPWALRVEDEAPLTLVAMLSGDAVLASAAPHAARTPSTLRAGDIAIVRGPHPCTMGDRLTTTPHAIIQAGPHCVTPPGVPRRQAMSWFGVRTWGNRADGATRFLVCTYRVHGEISGRLLDALPPLLVLPGGVDAPIVPLLADEALKDRPGQAVVLDRLIDVLLVAVVRAWFARPEARAPKWYHALSDPVVGGALRSLHDRPDRAWTVASLAREAGVSRAVLGRRFPALTGQSPMAYLTGWRLSLAADLLAQPDLTIAAIADRVGYGSAFALSSAFKRERGVSPQQHRDQVV